MKRLALHIISLLRLYDSVALPGCGVFTVTYRPAYLDRNLDSFFPPHLSLSFEARNATDDGLLLASYLRKESSPARKAKAMLRDDLAELSSLLALNGEASLPGLGTLGNDGSFSPDFALNPDLPVINPEIITIAEAPAHAEAPSQETEVAIPTPPPFPSDTSDQSDQSDQSSQPHRPDRLRNPEPFRSKLAKMVACFLLVAIVAVASVMPLGKPQSRTATASIMPIASEQQKTSPTDVAVANEAALSETRSASTSNFRKAQPAAPINADSVAAAKQEAFTDPGAASLPHRNYLTVGKDNVAKYHAVVAAFKSEKEAENFIMGHKGNKSRFNVLKKSSYYMISVSSTNDKTTLETDLPLIRADYPDAWILSLQ